jgi:acyl-CoA dehydrogenase
MAEEASMAEEYSGAGGNFAHESAIAEAIGRVGVDGFGISLHNPPRRFWIL